MTLKEDRGPEPVTYERNQDGAQQARRLGAYPRAHKGLELTTGVSLRDGGGS